jgi:hypothetical protein
MCFHNPKIISERWPRKGPVVSDAPGQLSESKLNCSFVIVHAVILGITQRVASPAGEKSAGETAGEPGDPARSLLRMEASPQGVLTRF